MKHVIFAALMSLGLMSTFVTSSASAMNVRRELVKVDATGTRVRMDVDVFSSSMLDILFVIDDSGSMGLHQQKLLANVDGIVRAAKASGVDIHAGVITTSVSGSVAPAASGGGLLVGSVKKYAATADGDFDSVLSNNLKAAMTTWGAATEQPFEAARLALSEPMASGPNRGFVRTDAALAIFLLTDADDQSPSPIEYYFNMVKALKVSAPVSLTAAYVPTAQPTCDTQGEPPAVRIEEALAKFGSQASSVSLCDADFATKLNQIGDGFGVAAIRTVQLKLAPILSTMHIAFGNQNIEAGDLEYGWVYDPAKMQIIFGNKVDWTSEPAGTRLLIDYLTN